MHNFYSWFSLGVSHILNWEAYDHVLFLFALCSIYTFRQWKKTFMLITAFTIGHSLTLALSMWHVFSMNTRWVEFLIALTIVLTCLYNIKIRNKAEVSDETGMMRSGTYLMACFFGLIHGLGFASILKDMLLDSTWFPLFSFNIGIEFGQLIVLTILLVIAYFVRTVYKFNQATLNVYVSSIIGVFALIIALSRLTDIFCH